jgi:anti-sigma regulatory factor (Ser/Thr protein kinase)
VHPTHRHRAQTFERSNREISRARRFVTGVLDEWGFTTHTGPFELMVSELVSNALVHGNGQIFVQLSHDGVALRLEVRDEGGGIDRPRLDQRTTGGWGLRFVDQLADGWGSEIRGDCTLVWAVRRSAATSPPANPSA